LKRNKARPSAKLPYLSTKKGRGDSAAARNHEKEEARRLCCLQEREKKNGELLPCREEGKPPLPPGRWEHSPLLPSRGGKKKKGARCSRRPSNTRRGREPLHMYIEEEKGTSSRIYPEKGKKPSRSLRKGEPGWLVPARVGGKGKGGRNRRVLFN